MEKIPLTKNVSYLRARDPSILGGNITGIEKIRINLAGVYPEPTPEIEEKEEDNLIKIYLRIKNGTNRHGLYQILNETITCNLLEGSQAGRNLREGHSVKKMYSFTKIFDPKATQSDIFNTIIKPKMLAFINGCDSTLLTYGASGSGKTFTVIGTDEDPGLVPRSLEYLFRTVQVSTQPRIKPLPSGDVIKMDDDESKKERQFCTNLLNSSNVSVKAHSKTYMAMQSRLSNEKAALVDNHGDVVCEIWVSYAEIYNEFIYDLLKQEPGRNQQRKKLRLGCSNGQTYIKDLTCINVSSGLEAYQAIQYGINNINYASTRINPHSSRSHTIFTVKLVQISKADGGVFISNFNFCDLAGSERLKKTNNVGDRLKESNNINSSLLVLGRCISAVREGQRHSDKLVPFRDSKLTQLFQNALAGNEDIVMIVNVSLSMEMFDETQHVLKFAAIAKDIAIESHQHKPKKISRFSQYLERQDSDPHNSSDSVERYRDAIAYLQVELESQRIEFEENIKLNRDRLINGYKEILEDKENFWKQKLETEVRDLKRHYEERQLFLKKEYDLEIRRMRDEFEEQIRRQKIYHNMMVRELKEQNSQIIVIDDSSADESFESGEGVSLEKQIKILKTDKQELIETLKDAEIEYKEAMEIINHKDTLNVKLIEEIKDLKYELEILRREMSSRASDDPDLPTVEETGDFEVINTIM